MREAVKQMQLLCGMRSASIHVEKLLCARRCSKYWEYSRKEVDKVLPLIEPIFWQRRCTIHNKYWMVLNATGELEDDHMTASNCVSTLV